ncbi:hypothetical protein QBZ16_003300 [Prototheca wickerhamii]|uniref:DUF1279 domain-containing protein n=1 Tax=Prototheca wickerhamii TaxID=3111 RepID=A0AAD9IJP6_PROWI|nr:hypothetical protein QBZ16_003300 [Prototheca wickerhamii]
MSQLVRKYGKVAIGVHLSVYAVFLAGCYGAVKSHVDVAGMLEKYGLMSKPSEEEEASWVHKMLAGSSSSLALAFVANKALIPVRVPITVALTPPVARFLQRMRGQDVAFE